MDCGRIGTSQRQCQEDLAAKATHAYISYGEKNGTDWKLSLHLIQYTGRVLNI